MQGQMKIFQKNPRAHKNKIGTPPPPKPKIPPPPPIKRGILWTWLFLQNGRIFPGVHKIGAAIPAPEIADKNFTDTRIFLSNCKSKIAMRQWGVNFYREASRCLAVGEGQKGTPGRGRDRKCHDRASLSRPLVLSLGPLTSLTSFPFFCTSEDIN